MTATMQKFRPHYASLYVGDLHPNVSEKDLWGFFSRVGAVSSARVCLDNVTRRSLGYGYVNFATIYEAERALDTLNNQPILDSPCRIMWSQRDPSIRRSGIGNIYIKNLDSNITHKELHDTFSVFGNILSCKVVTDENGKSRGFGFVHFESVEASEKAIVKTNGMYLEGTVNRIYVARHIPKKERLSQKADSWTNVFIKNLSAEVTEEELTTLFSEFGDITSACVKVYVAPTSAPIEGESLKECSFGFVNFKSHADALHAMEKLNGVQYKDRELYVARAQTKSERMEELVQKHNQMKIEQYKKFQGTNLFIKNLEDCITDERLRKEFSNFGKIRSAKVKQDSKGNSCGFGFVCFSSPEEAALAITGMNAHILPGCIKPLYVNLHEPREIRQHRLASQHHPKAMGYPHFMAQPVFYPPYPQNALPMVGPRQGRPWPPVQPGFYPITPLPGAPNVQPNQPRLSAPNSRNEPRRPSTAMPTSVPQSIRRPSNPRREPTMLPTMNQADTLTRETLEASPEYIRMALVGDRLFRLIAAKQHQHIAGKITGMILEAADNIDYLFSLTENDAALTQKINEAVKMLEEHKNQAKAEQ